MLCKTSVKEVPRISNVEIETMAFEILSPKYITFSF